jgi:hypothetical protein
MVTISQLYIKKMPGNIGSFKDLIEGKGKLFVDKTEFINAIINSGTDPLLITRPRRFGKTINMNMLFYYFVDRKQLKAMGKTDVYVKECDDLFENLNIFNPKLNSDLENTKEYFGKYPVIFASFAISGDDSSEDGISHPDWGKIKEMITGRIGELFSEFNYLTDALRKKIDDKFHEELSEKIERKEKSLQCQLSSDDKSKIWNELLIEQKERQEYQDLEQFIRLRRGRNATETDLHNSINFLAQLLFQFHGQPAYILIDEYDSLINKYFDKPKILDKLTKTFSGLFSAFTKPVGAMNDHVQKVIFTGILRVVKANIFSGLNNLRECTVLDKTFSSYYGFIQSEVKELMEKAQKSAALEEIQQWYNGYKIGEDIIYNPWAVMEFIAQNEFKPYWVDTANPGIIKDIILNNKGHSVNKKLREIISNGPRRCTKVIVKRKISVEDLRNPESIWSFLIHTGYLTVDSSELNNKTGDFECEVRIPNNEVETIYNSIVYDWLRQHSEMQGMMINLFEKDYEGFADNLRSLLVKRYDSP